MKELRKNLRAISRYYKYGMEVLDASEIRRLEMMMLNLKAGIGALIVGAMLYLLVLHT